MKKLTGLVIILAVLILGGYYGMGIFTEKAIKKNIQVINQSNGIYAEIKQYQRGWFNSNAIIQWSLHVPQRIITNADGKTETLAAQNYQTEMPLKVYHGPIIFADSKVRFGMGYAKTALAFPEQYNQKFDELFSAQSKKPELDLSIFVNYLSKSDMELSIPAFKLISKKDDGNFDWMGMQSFSSISSDMGKINGEVLIDGIKIAKDDTNATLGKISTEFDLHQTPTGIYLGDANLSFPLFTLVAKEQKAFEIKDFFLDSSSDIENGLFNTHLNFSMKSMQANNRFYGPGVLEINLRNLDADILAKINQQTSAMQNGTDAERQQAMIMMLPELPKLFGKGAELEIPKLSLKLPEGMVDGNLFVSLPKGENSNPFELLQKVQGNSKLKLPIVVLKQVLQQSLIQQMAKQPEVQQTLAQQLQPAQAQPGSNQVPLTPEQLAVMQADKQVATLEKNGVIVVNGTDYTIEVSLQQGKFTVNGKPFEPSMLNF